MLLYLILKSKYMRSLTRLCKCHEYHIPSVLNTVYEGIDGYASSDLLKPHPTKSGYWKVFGRTDDQIMHNTGEKVYYFNFLLSNSLLIKRGADKSWSFR